MTAEVKMMQYPEVTPFYDKETNTFSYVVKDPSSNDCAIIDSVLNFDYASGAISYMSADKIISFIKEKHLSPRLHIETHVHADHLSAAPYIQKRLGGKIAIDKHIVVIQEEFGRLFNEGTEFQRDGSQFDLLFEDKQKYSIGKLECMALYTPGHTPACMTHVIGDAAFVGDTLFMPDGGTARADFPGGDARVLYRSIQRVFALPDATRIFICHDYQPNGRELKFETSVGEQKEKNIHIHSSMTEDEFVVLREARDKTLGMPKLILPSLQINMRAGHFPAPDADENVYLKVPISGLK
jgi:glyoxylase-like metal-dependent hydrolase (beta-lactamase superfamily II)